MNLRKVLFLGGDPSKFASVQIRCVDIAQCLGADYALKINDLDQIPRSYSAFICVKPTLSRQQIRELAWRGTIIWDILDAIPPQEGIQLYLASTKHVQHSLNHFGRVDLIPHHHCNMNSHPNPANLRLPGWIGTKEWCPRLRGVRFFKFFIQGRTQESVIHAHRKIGIGLNFRLDRDWADPRHPEKLNFDFHVSVNSGIKLINCIGFGVPSVSSDEPAYRELGEAFTIFSSPAECADRVKELQANIPEDKHCRWSGGQLHAISPGAAR